MWRLVCCGRARCGARDAGAERARPEPLRIFLVPQLAARCHGWFVTGGHCLRVAQACGENVPGPGLVAASGAPGKTGEAA